MTMMPVSFLSDFGHSDEFVGVVHGVIARIEPSVPVLDITHGVPRGDVRSGAFALLRAVQYMPEGVVLAIVDPGVGTDRRAICARTPAGLFVGPDNGLLAPSVAMVGGADLVVSIENPELRLPAEGDTFAGRDLFAPAAAVLASGQASIEQLGPAVDPESITPLMVPLVDHRDGGAVGEVLWVDGFGNAQTNITPADLELLGFGPGSTLVLRIGAMEFPITWARTYGDVLEGEGLVHVDSYGQIAVAVRGGSAIDEYPLET
ncbi:MAG: SAM-dependent chlorinase/fluorinase, partial [Acidimicrobiia bacterium]|nr:SAM-dependent chlorinase/fluorinase [Acidimicrobiia bacterium]